jgi:hypothetical protein
MNTEMQDMAWVGGLIARHPKLSETAYQVMIRLDGHVAIEVQGSWREAMLWRAAISGRIYPSHVDVHGIRRQLVIGRGVQVQVIEHPVRHLGIGRATAA